MKKKSFFLKPALLLAASGLLLLGSTVGSARAALTYYSDSYNAQMSLSSIGVTLLENGEAVSKQDYKDNGVVSVGKGALLTDLLGEKENLIPGKKYNESLSVQNSGNIDTFVRVIVTKSWLNADGTTNQELSPSLIELQLTSGSGWQEDTTAATPERQVFYYQPLLAAGDKTPNIMDTIRIDNSIADEVNVIREGNTIKYEYKYDGCTFSLEAEVNAVQTHNAKDAIKSAWGVDVNVNADETRISL
ncbi:MAG: hypothetical protein PHQ72_01315 [Hespellia sp.]|nr:hypothetical protein [Hespellia sp.]